MEKELSPKTIKDTLDEAIEPLRSAGIGPADVNAELLLLFVLGLKRVDLYLKLGEEISSANWDKFFALIEERIRGKPVQYITNSANFFGIDLFVDQRVLIPRPETEILVEAVLERLKVKESHLQIVDWGTGSGNIAIALASFLDATVYALDRSPEALKVAGKNLQTYALENKIKLLCGEGFGPLPENLKRNIDAVVSNPPYVRLAEKESLPIEIRGHEPEGALFDRGDGLHYTKEIINGAVGFLKPGRLLALETGLGLAQKVKEEMEMKGFGNIEIIRDLSGIERVVLGEKP